MSPQLTPDQLVTEQQIQRMAGLRLNGGQPGPPPGVIESQQRAAAMSVPVLPVAQRPSLLPPDLTDEEKQDLLNAGYVLDAEGNLLPPPSSPPVPMPMLDRDGRVTMSSEPPQGGRPFPAQQAVIGWGRKGGLRVSRVSGAQKETWTLPAEAQAPLVALLRAFGLTVVDLTREDEDEDGGQEEGRDSKTHDWDRGRPVPAPGAGTAAGAFGSLPLRGADVRSGVSDPEPHTDPLGGIGAGGAAIDGGGGVRPEPVPGAAQPASGAAAERPGRRPSGGARAALPE